MMREAGEGPRGSGSRVTWRGALVLVCAVLMGACRDPARASGTALYVTTEFAPTLLLTQVRVWGSVEGGQPFGPHVLPERPSRLLYSGETLRVLLGDVPHGTRAKVSIEGLRDGLVVARGGGSASIRDGYEVDVTLRLEPSPPVPVDGGDGGAGGVACVACDSMRTDTCDTRGVCVCGANPICNAMGVDRCVNGQCRCGTGPACAPGQECVDGACRCTTSSCSGCCSGTTCEPGNTRDKCGKGGELCRRCGRGCATDRTCIN